MSLIKKGNDNSHSGEKEKLVDLQKVYTIIIKNWKVMSRDKVRLAPLFMFPILMLVIFGYTAGNIPQFIPAALVDYDNTTLSHQLASEIYANQLFSIEHVVGSQEEGRKLIDSGTVKVLFIIPDGFGDAITNNKPTTLSVIADESDPTIAQIVKASTQAFVGQLSSNFTSQRLMEISQRAAMQAQALQLVSQSLGTAQGQSQSSAATSQLTTALQNTKIIINKENTPLQIAYEQLYNSVGYIPGAGTTLSTPTTSDASVIGQLISASAKQAVRNQANAEQAQIGANNALLLNALLSNAAGQQIAMQNAQLNAQVSLSINSIEGTKDELVKLSADAQSAATAGVNYDPLNPYGSGRRGIDFLLPSILALIIFQGAAAGLGRAVAGERQDGSLTRVFLTPTSNLTIIFGTQFFYALFEIFRSSAMILLGIVLFGVTISGNILDIFAIVALFAVGSTGVGMVLSVLTKTQEQYMAIVMLITFPMLFLAGVFLPIQTMPPFFQGVAKVLPITYAADALRGIMVKGFGLTQVIPDLAYMAAFAAAMFGLTLLFFKRELV